ncbi:hypothetical protein PJ311_00190 [Bacillus sp. CLL-7-23]|uniref:Uncharacterized protein n=1 Tax=Bacillus changyiensis TaxID=3004103 RepID=A0ABT4X0S6_9BACI|nr:hypothetical protein [Bacillus changyiensis]MDA7025026.1 hypothetical protein [Bacillus changyiensis]
MYEDDGTTFIEVFNTKTLKGEVPEFQDNHRELYSSVLYEFSGENRVSIKVPEKDVQAIKQFREQCAALLKELLKDNSTLAYKLARYHKF